MSSASSGRNWSYFVLHAVLWTGVGAAAVKVFGGSREPLNTVEQQCRRIESAVHELKLDPEQQTRIQDILRGYRDHVSRVHRNLADELGGLEARTDQAIAGVLTEPQRAAVLAREP